MRRLLILLAATLAAALCASPGAAHTRSESNAVWEVNGGAVDLVLTIPEAELRRLAPHEAAPDDAAVEAYLARRVYPLSGRRPCALAPPVTALSATTGYRKYDLTFRCPAGPELKAHFGAFFDLVPSHVNFAQVQNVATGEFTEELVTRDRQTIDLTGGEGSRLQRAGFLDFVRMGVMHILTGVDHMSFLLGLVLIARRLRDLVFVVTGFTIGHSLTLGLAVTGVIRPHPEYIDALVALTIALIGAENLVAATGRAREVAWTLGGALGLMAVARLFGHGGLPSLLLLGSGLFAANYLAVSGRLADAGRLRMVITLVFGLIHGFGFAADLLRLQLPRLRLAELLVGFNLGVEAGQLALVLGVTLVAALLVRLRLAPPRPAVVELSSAGLIGLGAYWFVSRSFI